MAWMSGPMSSSTKLLQPSEARARAVNLVAVERQHAASKVLRVRVTLLRITVLSLNSENYAHELQPQGGVGNARSPQINVVPARRRTAVDRAHRSQGGPASALTTRCPPTTENGRHAETLFVAAGRLARKA